MVEFDCCYFSVESRCGCVVILICLWVRSACALEMSLVLRFAVEVRSVYAVGAALVVLFAH